MKKKLPKAPPCYICQNPNTEWHHIRTRGAGGSDHPSNLLSLCRPHHFEVHRIGVKSFAEKYIIPIDFSGIYPELKI